MSDLGIVVTPWLGIIEPEVMLRPYCWQHGRFRDATGLCPTCQKEAHAVSVRRASEETARHAAVDGELVQLAEMYGL
jgi:hypothetical protein